MEEIPSTEPHSPESFAPEGFLPVHGGDIAGAEARFGVPEAGWLDLSTGINPFAYPVGELPPAVWQRLPDAGAETALREAAAAYYNAPSPDQVVCAAGTQALIQWLPHLVPLSKVAVVGPTYAEHARSWAATGHQVEVGTEMNIAHDSRVVIVVNPNNPDGRRLDPDGLADLASWLAERDGLLVVDEAFGDVAPDLSVVPKVRPGMVVLRSFGKFFGLAGLRLGFAIAEPALADGLRTLLGPWPVSGPAMAVGRMALSDQDWIKESRLRLAEQAAALDEVLTAAGMTIQGGTSLFRLVSAPRAWALYEHLARKGILVRPFPEWPRWLRFGLPAGDEDRDRLRQALADWPG